MRLYKRTFSVNTVLTRNQAPPPSIISPPSVLQKLVAQVYLPPIYLQFKQCCVGIFISNLSPPRPYTETIEHVKCYKNSSMTQQKKYTIASITEYQFSVLFMCPVSFASHVAQKTPIVGSNHESFSHMRLQRVNIETVFYLSVILPELRSDDFSKY